MPIKERDIVFGFTVHSFWYHNFGSEWFLRPFDYPLWRGVLPPWGVQYLWFRKKNGGTYSSMQAGKYGLSKVKIRGFFFNKSSAAILNSEKAKPVGQSHSSDFWSMVLVLSHETIKLSITRNKGGTVAASRLYAINTYFISDS